MVVGVLDIFKEEGGDDAGFDDAGGEEAGGSEDVTVDDETDITVEV